MERRSFVQGAGLAGILAAGMAPAVVHAQANIRWRLASSFPKSLDTIYGAAETAAKTVRIPRRTTSSARTRPSRWAAPSRSA